eukprot:12882248-Prorocentrum_lima.AAC.1
MSKNINLEAQPRLGPAFFIHGFCVPHIFSSLVPPAKKLPHVLLYLAIKDKMSPKTHLEK